MVKDLRHHSHAVHHRHWLSNNFTATQSWLYEFNWIVCSEFIEICTELVDHTRNGLVDEAMHSFWVACQSFDLVADEFDIRSYQFLNVNQVILT